MTLSVFLLTVLSSVIGAGIGAAIAYYFGNNQIKKQIDHNIDIYDASIKYSNINEIKMRLIRIFSHEIPSVQNQVIHAEYKSQDDLERFLNSSNLDWYIQPVQLFYEVYLLSTGLESSITPEINEEKLKAIIDKISKNYINLTLPINDEDYSKTFKYLNSKLTEFIEDVGRLMSILNHEIILLENIKNREEYIKRFVEKSKKINLKTHES